MSVFSHLRSVIFSVDINESVAIHVTTANMHKSHRFVLEEDGRLVRDAETFSDILRGLEYTPPIGLSVGDVVVNLDRIVATVIGFTPGGSPIVAGLSLSWEGGTKWVADPDKCIRIA